MFVFVTSPWVPWEWISAHGLVPRGIWMDLELNIPGTPLQAGSCAFSQSMIAFAEAHPQEAVVFTTHCDQMRRGFDAAARAHPANLFLFNLPATIGTTASLRIIRDELDRLSRFLIRLGGHAPQNLESLVRQRRKAQASVLAWSRKAGGRAGAEAMARFLNDGSEPDGLGVPLPSASQPAIALIGGPIPQSQWTVFDTLQKAGASITVNGTENGERALESTTRPLPTDSESLAEVCANRCLDVYQRPNTRLYTWFKKRFTENPIRGIVLWSYVNCDLWRAEAATLKETFGLPLLTLEAHETLADATRARTRIEAFMETLT